MATVEGRSVDLENGGKVFLAEAPEGFPGEWLICMTNAEGAETKFQVSDQALKALVRLAQPKRLSHLQRWVLMTQDDATKDDAS